MRMGEMRGRGDMESKSRAPKVCRDFFFPFLFTLLTISIPSPPVFDVFRHNQRGFNPSPVVFDALASAQRCNEEGFSLLVTSIWQTRRGRGWVQPSPFGFDVFRHVRGVFNPSSSSRRERERVQPLIVRFRPGWTRTRRGLISLRLFSTRFDAN